MIYEFTKEGLERFKDAALDETMENYSPLVLSVGAHKISIFMCPETFESMEIMLKESLNIYEEEYK